GHVQLLLGLLDVDRMGADPGDRLVRIQEAAPGRGKGDADDEQQDGEHDLPEHAEPPAPRRRRLAVANNRADRGRRVDRVTVTAVLAGATTHTSLERRPHSTKPAPEGACRSRVSDPAAATVIALPPSRPAASRSGSPATAAPT